MKISKNHPYLPVKMIKAKDCILWDENEREYLDLHGGNGAISIGHNHSDFLNSFHNPSQDPFNSTESKRILIQEKLIALLNQKNYKMHLCHSAEEANETALKIAFSHTGKKQGIAFHGSSHTHLNMSLLDYDLDQVKKMILEKEIGAVIYEPIQVSRGITLPNNEFVRELREVCSRNKVLFIVNEVESGFGRTGKFFAHQHAEIRADLITFSKGIGLDIPMGGILIYPEIEIENEISKIELKEPNLVHTAILATLEIIENEHLIQNADEMGFYISRALNRYPKINDIRGRGLLMGIEFDFPIAEMVRNLAEKHRIIVGSSNKNVLHLTPPLTLKKAYVDKFLNALEEEILK